MSPFAEKLAAALYGVAIGDAMGAPLEGKAAVDIQAKLRGHDFLTFLPGKNRKIGKGFGRITDDTLMTEALMRAYARHGNHLDAHGYVSALLPEITQTKVWLPERRQEMPIFERLYWPEKYPWLRLTKANADPRTAGVGNMVNCGLAMFMLPVGAINAGDPGGAYQEAVALGAAHNESYAVEAAAVLAAAYAEALAPDATLASVLRVVGELAKDGTGSAIAAALAAVRPRQSLKRFSTMVRTAMIPFDGRPEHMAENVQSGEVNASDTSRPSRLLAIEEVPVALAAVKFAGGEFSPVLRAAVSYGRDCDSIASMATGLAAALGGLGVVPVRLRRQVDSANRRDFLSEAASFASVAGKIAERDSMRLQRRMRVLLP